MSREFRKRLIMVPRYCYPLVEKYLSKMSENGWELMDYDSFIYYFEKAQPASRKYFISALLGGVKNDDGYFDISLRHPCLYTHYGKNGKKSGFNKRTSKKPKNIIIFEVDTSKIDEGFFELLADRKKYGFLDLVKNSLAIIGGLLYFRITYPEPAIVASILTVLIMIISVNLVIAGLVYFLDKAEK